MTIKLRAWRIVGTIVALMIIGFFMLASYVRRSVATCWVSTARASASAGPSSWYNFRTDMARAPLGLPGDGSIQGGPSRDARSAPVGRMPIIRNEALSSAGATKQRT